MRIGIGTGVTAPLCLRPGLSPGSLFRPGNTGFWYDPSVMTTLSQDTSGAVPVAAVTQPVGRIADRSGRGIHAVQATAGLRPLYARVPQGGRRNLLPNNSAGAVVGVIGGGGALPTGWAASTSLAREIVGVGTTDGVPWFDLKLTGTLTGGYFIDTSATMAVAAVAGQTWVASAFVSAIGAVAGANTLTLVPSSRLAVGNLKFAYPAVTIGFPSSLMRFTTPATLLSDADGVAGATAYFLGYLRLGCTGTVDVTLRIGGAQVEQSSVATALQVNSSAQDITEAGKSSRYYLSDDQIDDALVATMPAGTYTVAYGDDAGVVILTGQALSGAYTIPGPVRLYGAVAINRSLTAGETASLTAWLNGRRP